MQYKITSFTSFITSEGERLSYTYSKINEETGDIIESNIRKTMVVPDSASDILDSCKLIKDYLQKKLTNE